jgi:hypothetical protein
VAVLDRVLSAVLALVLVVAGPLLAVEILLAGLDRPPWLVPHDRWAATARTTAWSDGDVRLVLVGLVVAGLVLLVVESGRRRPQALALAARGAGVAVELDRRHLEHWLVAQVEQVEGVASAQAKIGSRTAVIGATAVGRDTGPVAARVREAVTGHLDGLGLDRMPRVRVKVEAGKAPR